MSEQDQEGAGMQDVVDRLDKIIDLLRPAPAEQERPDGTRLVQEPKASPDSGGDDVRS